MATVKIKLKKPPLKKVMMSDTIPSDTTKVQPFMIGTDKKKVDQAAAEELRRTLTEEEKAKTDTEGKSLSEEDLIVLRGGTKVVPTPKPRETVPPPPVRKIPFKKLKVTPRGYGRGERPPK